MSTGRKDEPARTDDGDAARGDADRPARPLPASVDIELQPTGEDAPSRGTPPRYTPRAARSSLRRYPKAIARSLRDRGETATEPAVDPRIPDHLVPIDPEGTERELDRLAGSGFGAAWLGHASVVLRIGDHLVLADPVLSDRIGLRLGRVVIGKHRLAPAPTSPERAGGPDLVLLTHAHYDHLDRPTLARLADPARTVVTARGTKTLIPPGFRRVIEIEWGETLRFGDLRIHALRPVHWGARTLLDRHRGFNSYLLETSGRRVLLAGDTADTDAFDHLREVDLAVMGIGAYDPWEAAHATPEQVWRMATAMGAAKLLPMHHATFELSDEPIPEPLERLLAAARDETERVVLIAPGEAWVPEEGA